MSRHLYLSLGVLICALSLSTVANSYAAAPQLITYQGQITDALGDPIDTTIDPDGISLAAIKALIEKNKVLETQNDELLERLERLENLIFEMNTK